MKMLPLQRILGINCVVKVCKSSSRSWLWLDWFFAETKDLLHQRHMNQHQLPRQEPPYAHTNQGKGPTKKKKKKSRKGQNVLISRFHAPIKVYSMLHQRETHSIIIVSIHTHTHTSMLVCVCVWIRKLQNIP